MTARQKLKAIMAGKKLVLMPGAYDALSARVIEAEGFEAIVAGGYAGVCRRSSTSRSVAFACVSDLADTPRAARLAQLT